ncbi:MAG: Ig-like domain-containing protein, partial [Cyanobacteria bacterium J06643_4]
LLSGPNNGGLFLSPDGGFEYIPFEGFSGTDSFVYVANDGIDDSNATTVYIDVTNEVPIANEDFFSVHSNESLVVDFQNGVLANDTDADGDGLLTNLLSGPNNGGLFLSPDGGFEYIPFEGFSGFDSFVYVANDSIDDSVATTVYITVNAVQEIIGTTANDLLIGKAKNEIIDGLAGNDVLKGKAGNDQLRGGLGNDSLNGGTGGDVLDGGDGIDSANYRTSQSGVTVNLATNSATGGEATGDSLISIERLYGSLFDDVLTGDDQNNILVGYAGDDVFVGGAGNDLMIGHDGADSFDGGSGVDTVNYRTSQAAVAIDLTAGTASGGDAEGDSLTSIERLYGSAFNDSLIGDAGNNVFNGLGGADLIDGKGGVDTVIYRNSNAGVRVNLASGVGRDGHAEGDILQGIERVYGSNANDVLEGDGRKNRLYGLGGDDVLDGGGGADLLVGGGGTDVFVFQSLADSRMAKMDAITDFAIGNDLLNTVNTLSANQVTQLGAVTSLSEADVQAQLTTAAFVANEAATFTMGARTFLAMNDGQAGYAEDRDSVVEITGFTGNLSALSTI